MKFEFYLISCTEREQLSLFPVTMDRRAFLKTVLGEEHRFMHYNTEYAWKFLQPVDDFVVGAFAKHSSESVNLPPEQNFALTSIEDWPFSRTFVNISDDYKHGQRIIIQYNSEVSKNFPTLLTAFAESLNYRFHDLPFYITIIPITEKNRFWNIIEENEGNIEVIRFELVPPNILRLQNAPSQDLKDIKQRYNGSIIKFAIEDDDGRVRATRGDPLLEESVDYVERGGGKFVISLKRIRKKRTFTSDESTETREVDIGSAEIIGDADTVRRALRLIIDE